VEADDLPVAELPHVDHRLLDGDPARAPGAALAADRDHAVLADRRDLLRVDLEVIPGVEPGADPLEVAVDAVEGARVGQVGRRVHLDVRVEQRDHHLGPSFT
jgi:hypothetical protein